MVFATTRSPHATGGTATQDRILEDLRSGSAARHPGLLAARLGLHPSTVRRHLQVLETLGLVERVIDDGRGPGRPRVRYRATTSPGQTTPLCVGYRFVADSLARWLEASADDPLATATQIGSAWGRHLVNAPPFTHVDHEEALRRVFGLLADLGYAPSRAIDGGMAIEIGRCPFQQLAASHPDVGCGLHLGIIQGALGSLGADLEVADARIAPGEAEQPCVVELRAVTPSARRTSGAPVTRGS